MELICPPLVPDEVRVKSASSFEEERFQAEGREAPHTHGITSTSSYVFANGDSGLAIISVNIKENTRIMMLQEAEGAALSQLRITTPPPLSLPALSLMEGSDYLEAKP